MPYKDKEEQKKAHRELMRKRRAAKKAYVQADSKVEVSPTSIKDSVSAPFRVENPPAKPEKSLLTLELQKPKQIRLIETDMPITQVVEESQKQLDKKGWVMWRCTNFGDEHIIIVLDDMVTGYPKGYPVFTADEMEKVENMTSKQISAAIRVKKAMRAEII